MLPSKSSLNDCSSVLDRELLQLRSLARTLRADADEHLRRRWSAGVVAFGKAIDVDLREWVGSFEIVLPELLFAQVAADELADVLHRTSLRVAEEFTASRSRARLASAIRCVIWTQYSSEVVGDAWFVGPEQELCCPDRGDDSDDDLDEAVLDLVTQYAHRVALDSAADLEGELVRGEAKRCEATGVGLLFRCLVEAGDVLRLWDRAHDRLTQVEKQHRALLHALGE